MPTDLPPGTSDKGVEAAVKRLELAITEIGRGPNNSAIGHVIEDCALVHMDYLAGADGAVSLIAETIAEATGEAVPEIAARLRPARQCDCPSKGCGGEKSAEIRKLRARAEHYEWAADNFAAALNASQPEEAS